VLTQFRFAVGAHPTLEARNAGIGLSDAQFFGGIANNDLTIEDTNDRRS
jgi:hypothetical protein